MRELAELVHVENGKTTDDALFEVSVAIEHLDWAARHAEKVLGRHRARPGVLTANHAMSVERHPFGVVGVIGPWNYPVHTPLGSITYALAAGNAVVFKPSEFTPAVGRWLATSFAHAVPEQPVFTVVTGFADTGTALVPKRGRQDRVHRLHGNGEEGHGRLRRVVDAGGPRVRRQGRDDRGRGRRR